MSLTPFSSRYDDPFGDDGFDDFGSYDSLGYRYGGADGWPDLDDGYFDSLQDELDLIESQTDRCYPDYDIPYETELAWKEHRPEVRLLPIVAAPVTLEERLADMAWLRTPAHRDINPTRKARKGQRYSAPEHGSALARKHNTALRRERLRKARQHRHTKHYTPDWKLRAMREDQTTWGDAHYDLAEIDRWGIAHGLSQLAITTGCGDPWCCTPSDLYDDMFYGSGFGGYDSFYDEFDDPFWGASLSLAGRGFDDFDW